MKIKRLLFFIALTLGLTTLMSTTCQKDDPKNPSSCSAPISATATGNLSSNFCFDVFVSYDYIFQERVTLVSRQDGDQVYGCTIELSSTNGLFSGPGTYQCGIGEIGYIELIMHGTENEFYKAQSGTLSVTQVDANNFKGTFNVVTKGYYNNQIVNFSGTFSK